MSLPSQSIESLLSRYTESILLLRQMVEKNFPDLKGKEYISDGTKIDDIFYLRYVLSSKTPLKTLGEVEDSNTLKDVFEGLKWRNGAHEKKLSSADELELLNVIPLLRTGELKNGSPVMFLPVKDVDMELIAKNQGNKLFEDRLLAQILHQKSIIFEELDMKTRETGKLVKSVVVYDLNGLCYSDIYKLSGFFKMMGNQGKYFKKLFPQYSEQTLIVNTPAASLLKKFLTSSKQQIVSVKQLHKILDSKECLPKQVGGSFVWPKSEDDWKLIVSGKSLNNFEDEVVELEMKSIKRQVSIATVDSEAMARVSSVNHKKQNKKIILTTLEREMITMKKNKLFSIDVLEKNQRVNLFFTNARKKKANILVVIKEEENTFTNAAVLPSGHGSLSLKLKSKGEILLVYLDTRMALAFNSDLETMKLQRPAVQRVYRFGKKKLGFKQTIKLTEKVSKLRKQNKLDEFLDLRHANGVSREKNLSALGLTQLDKVMFKFEVSDNVVCGNFGGERSIKESEVLQFKENAPSAAEYEVCSEPEVKSTREMIDYEARSLCSADSVIVGRPSFFLTAANILSRGW